MGYFVEIEKSTAVIPAAGCWMDSANVIPAVALR